jgi:predicted enzyme related to lactoylglutathione lyase
MASNGKPATGTIGWIDLTIDNAEEVRDFYAAVTGWQPEPVVMGGYDDFNMVSPETGQAVAGVCHARGGNAGLPPVWMIYIVVADLDASVDACRHNGGEVLAGPRRIGGDRYCVIRDPAGAVAALYQRA